jgi:hypothetical protein
LRRNQVFISYSHSDSHFLEEFQPHLRFLEKRGLVNFWDDRKIEYGADWRKEIEQALGRARVAILLVSQNFLVSDFINEEELPVLLEAAQKGEAVIWPIIVGYCLFGTSSLSAFQALNNPLRPLDTLKRSEREKLWTQIAAQLASFLKEEGK